MKPKIALILLDENDLLNLICEKNNINREEASMNINYVENNHDIPGSWIVQVQAPEIKNIDKKSKIILLPINQIT
ncbi:hypothetical protein EG359_17310 [Chryseobacterium joostei]|uniref:Uncharacterized protein n=1 Tax=Chryseobacterium joostei TaxID=112234 RepID=A0A1N7IB00_9FLAO|nr:hypothetical protein [Chryseobacterium joostei]AZB01262.1 hypothetical protein EG359_17310 [Chryseobacterium joostei]SIS34245.1 hypothetical protein SAMN05421768_103661 [Chryseobacterium joostei]